MIIYAVFPPTLLLAIKKRKNSRFDSLTASSEEVCMVRLFVDKHIPATLGCAALVLSSMGIGYSSGAQVESRIRTIDYGTREPIASRLLPEDEVVMIHREFDVAVPRPDATVSDVLKDAVQRSDVVAIVDIHEVSGRLVDDGTWIRTRIVGAVHEIIRSSKAGRFTQKQRLEIDITGGEVRIGKVLVEAEALQLVADRRYLLFLKVDDKSGDLWVSHTPLRIENRVLVNTQPVNFRLVPDPLDGLELNVVTKQVRQIKK
jgi:hypothetical protein